MTSVLIPPQAPQKRKGLFRCAKKGLENHPGNSLETPPPLWQAMLIYVFWVVFYIYFIYASTAEDDYYSWYLDVFWQPLSRHMNHLDYKWLF